MATCLQSCEPKVRLLSHTVMFHCNVSVFGSSEHERHRFNIIDQWSECLLVGESCRHQTWTHRAESCWTWTDNNWGIEDIMRKTFQCVCTFTHHENETIWSSSDVLSFTRGYGAKVLVWIRKQEFVLKRCCWIFSTGVMDVWKMQSDVILQKSLIDLYDFVTVKYTIIMLLRHTHPTTPQKYFV